MTHSNGHTTEDLGTNRPHGARVYDYLLGGKTNYAPDRKAAAQALLAYPDVMVAVRQNRWFMHRVTRYLAEQRGYRQYLDIGTGLPTEPNLHQVAQTHVADARVVYVDNDPLVLIYARGLLTSTQQGITDYVEADFRDPGTILEGARRTLDFGEPIVLSLIALLHFVPGDAYGIVRELLSELPPGSALALSHGTADLDPVGMRKLTEVYDEQGIPNCLRRKDEVARFFDGLEMVEPGLVPSCDWRPEVDDADVQTLPGMVSASEVGVWAGLGIKH
jgi:hypothetical protein